MKKNFLKLLNVAVLSIFIVACSNPSKMAKHADLVKTECEPSILEVKGGKIDANYTITFPEKFFLSEAILNVTPVLLYGNGKQVVGPVLTLQGDKIMDNYNVIPYENGGTISKNVSFDYKPGMEKATLELRAVVYNAKRSKQYKFPYGYKIADGTICTSLLANASGTPSFEEDNYQQVIKETKESQILYKINQADVRNSELNSKGIKELQEYLKNLKGDDRRRIVSNDIIAYASPDGDYNDNTKLSERRAKTAKNAFEKNISKKADVKNIPLNVSQISEDWEGFQELVAASDIQDKELILRVLSMYSDPAVREREIKNMSAVFQTLADEVLPALRRARFVTNVEFQNYTDEELAKIISGSNEGIIDIDELDEEALLYGATLFENREIKEKLYKKAAKNFNSDRAYNNLATLCLQDGKYRDAKNYLEKISNKDNSFYNNMAVICMSENDYNSAKEYLENAGELKAAKENLGAIKILEGDYQGAAEDLKGTNSYNEALVNLLNNNLAEASSILGDTECPKYSYLRAIIAARQGQVAEANAQLDKAKVVKELAERSKNDIEFVKTNL